MTRYPRIGSIIAAASIPVLVPTGLGRLDVRGLSLKTIVVHSHKSAPAYAALEDIRELPDRILVPSRNDSYEGDSFVEVQIAAGTAPIVLEKWFPTQVNPAETAGETPMRLSKIEIHLNPVSATPKTILAANGPYFEPKLRTDSGQLLPLEQRKQQLLNYYSTMDFSASSLSERAAPLIQKALHPTPHAVAPAAAQPAPAARPALLAQAVHGNIEVTGGLAFLGPETRIRVQRRMGAQLKESADVNIQEGRFDILVKEPKGTLEAVMLNPQDQVMGRGTLDLSRVAPGAAPLIKLHPVRPGGTISVSSAYSFGNHKEEITASTVTVDGYKAVLAQNDDGEFLQPNLHPQSIFVARAEAKNYWGTLAVGIGERALDVKMFPNKMVQALLDLTNTDGEAAARQQAIIWGRVVDQDGKPVNGAIVELAGDAQAVPVYFNNYYLPDRAYGQTSETGIFAFVKVTPGLHSLRAKVDGRFLPAQTLPAEINYVSYVELQGGELKTADLRIHDAFDENVSLNGAVNVLGAEINVEATGAATLQYPSGQGTMALEVDAGEDYEFARLQLPRDLSEIDVPMIRRDWISELAARRSITPDPNQARFVGFVNDDDFNIEVTRDGRPLVASVVYFDHWGLPFSAGPAGGGFAIYNIPQGPIELTVKFAHSNKIAFQTRYVEPDAVDLVAFSAFPRGLER